MFHGLIETVPVYELPETVGGSTGVPTSVTTTPLVRSPRTSVAMAGASRRAQHTPQTLAGVYNIRYNNGNITPQQLPRRAEAVVSPPSTKKKLSPQNSIVRSLLKYQQTSSYGNVTSPSRNAATSIYKMNSGDVETAEISMTDIAAFDAFSIKGKNFENN